MHIFQSEGVTIAFHDEGEGEPILLIHGFGSSAKVNWIDRGWVKSLAGAGFRVLALDNRGHGGSEKLYERGSYRISLMAGDARRLLDHLSIESADVMGYSMGARIATRLALDQPARLRSLILGGVGTNLLDGFRDGNAISAALLAADPASVTTDPGRAYRGFADRTGSDLRALAACIQAPTETFGESELASIGMPTLVAYGAGDPYAETAGALAELFPHAELLQIPGRDHMNVVGDPRLQAGVIDFLARRP